MHIAVCSADINERYELSRLADDILLGQGVLTEISMFPMLSELLTASEKSTIPFELIIIVFAGNTAEVKSLCRQTAVIVVGNKRDGPDAFEVGAEYFLENPVDRQQLGKAISRCFRHRTRK